MRRVGRGVFGTSQAPTLSVSNFISMVGRRFERPTRSNIHGVVRQERRLVEVYVPLESRAGHRSPAAIRLLPALLRMSAGWAYQIRFGIVHPFSYYLFECWFFATTRVCRIAPLAIHWLCFIDNHRLLCSAEACGITRARACRKTGHWLLFASCNGAVAML